jgi:peptidylprolyl isomerase
MKTKLYKNKLVVFFAVFLILIAALVSYEVINGNIFGNRKGGIVLLMTSMGNITVELWDDMPITTDNFKNIIRQGYYDNTTFHRIVKDFAIQGGDLGGRSVPTISDERSSNPDHNRNLRGRIAMANTGAPNSASSQFFFNLDDSNTRLDGGYAVFGKVINGTAVMDEIGNVPTEYNPTYDETSKPVTPVYLVKAIIMNEG